MSIEIGSKVKIKEDTEPLHLAGKTGVVVPDPDNAPNDWEWSVQLDFDKDAGPFGYNSDELEVIQ